MSLLALKWNPPHDGRERISEEFRYENDLTASTNQFHPSVTRPPSAPWCDKESKASTRPSDSSIMYPNKRMCQYAGVRDHPIWVPTVVNLVKTTGPAHSQGCVRLTLQNSFTQRTLTKLTLKHTHITGVGRKKTVRRVKTEIYDCWCWKFNCFSSIKPECFHTHQCMSPKYAGFCEIARKKTKHLFIGSADTDNTSDLLRRKSLLRRVVCISCAYSRLLLGIIFALSAGNFTHPLSCLSLCN